MRSLFAAVFFLCFRSGFLAVVDISTNTQTSLTENQKVGVVFAILDEAATTDNVIVVCSAVQTQPGSSQVVFSNSTALVGQTTATVQFSVVSAGQPFSFQCSGQSDGNSNQFNFTASKGNTSSLQITKAPVVSICNTEVLVDTSQSCPTVTVKLSEQVSGSFPAAVTCSTLGNSTGSAQLKFEPAIAAVGTTKVEVLYRVLSSGTASHSVQVVCRAQTYKIVITSNSTCGTTPAPIVPTTAPTAAADNTTAAPVLPTAAPITVVVSTFNASLEGVAVVQYASDTSTSEPVTFHTPELSLHPAAVTMYGTYVISLTLSTPQTLPLDVECSLTSAQSQQQQQINNSTITCPPKPIGSATLAESNIQLKLEKTEIQFKRNEILKTLSLSLSGTPTAQIKDLVQVTCCPKESLAPVPSPVRASLFVELFRQKNITWSDITAGQKSSTSPLDIDLSCPCDLVESECDIGCCCDKNCAESEKTAFTCISGFYGGASIERPFEFSCQATWPDSTDWQPVLCVTVNNSPFVGYFYNYTSPSTAQDTPQYTSLIGGASKTRYSYQDASQTTTSSPGSYKLGTTIKTAANSKDTRYLTASLGILSLPTNVYSGLCSQNVPVRFLENRESECTVELSESLCTGSSTLSASSFLMPRTISNPSCPVVPAVLKDGVLAILVDQPPNLADAQVEYYCTSDVNSALAKTGSGTADGTDGNPSLFSTGKPRAQGSKRWRCGFDDGKTPAPSPSFNSATRTCSNVILNVTYQLQWSARQVVKVLATLVLGDVVMGTQTAAPGGLVTSESAVNSLTQRFVAKFVHLPLYSASSNVSNASLTPPVITQLAGNPGYLRGLSLIGATITGQNYSNSKLSLWSPGGDGLCASASTTDMLYGQAMSSGCLLRLSLDDMRNCTQLRDLVRTNQDALIQATHVARTGNARVDMNGDWLPIIREAYSSPPAATNDYTVGECTHIPAGLQAEVLVSEAGKYGGVPQMEVVGMKLSYQYETWNYNCLSGYGLSCLATNASSNATVTGNATVTPSNTSSNASVTQPNVTSNATGGNYGQRLQYFMVKSSVVFVQVPPTTPTRVKRSLDQSGLCREDVCKEELFYPLSPGYQGEPREKVVALSLILIFMAMVTFAVTRPWG